MRQRLSAAETFDREFLPLRGKLLEVAASLDRIERSNAATLSAPRMKQVERALEVLRQLGANRAEELQMIFSLPYDPNWKKPT